MHAIGCVRWAHRQDESIAQKGVGGAICPHCASSRGGGNPGPHLLLGFSGPRVYMLHGISTRPEFGKVTSKNVIVSCSCALGHGKSARNNHMPRQESQITVS